MALRITIVVDGRKYEVEIAEEGDNSFRVKIGDREYRVHLLENSPLSTAVRNILQKFQPRKAAEAVARERRDSSILYSEIPGRIVKYFVKEGDYVRKGDPIAIVESMKMEIELKSDRDGKIKKILVPPGAFVNMYDPLVQFE